MTDRLPDGLVPSATSPIFTQDTLPDTLQAEHTLAPDTGDAERIRGQSAVR